MSTHSASLENIMNHMPFLMITIVVRYGQLPYYRSKVLQPCPDLLPYAASDY